MNWEHFANQSHELMCTCDARGALEWTNARWRELLDHTVEPHASTSLLDVVHPGDATDTLAALERAGRGDDPPVLLVNRLRHTNGNFLWIEWRVSQPEAGGSICLIGQPVSKEAAPGREREEELEAHASTSRWRVTMQDLIEDVTEDRTHAERHMHTERLAMIGQMAAGVAHEINNPLQFITLNLELLELDLEELGADASSFEALEHIHEGVRRIGSIVNALNGFVGRPPATPQRCAPSTLLHGALALVDKFARRHIVVDIEPDLPEVDVNPQEIHHVLLSLVRNALLSNQAAGGARRVRVEVARALTERGEQIVWNVFDEGLGLSGVDLEQPFVPFFTAWPDGKGTGLGLPIARGLAASNGGSITLIRRAERGAVARLVLPVAAAQTAQEGSTPDRTRLKILVVDDETLILEALGASLRASGFEVMTADGVDEALDVLSVRVDWDVVLCDMKMPGRSGKELWETLKAELPALEPRLHFMTGDSWSRDNAPFLAALGRPYLNKPFGADELRTFVDALAGNLTS